MKIKSRVKYTAPRLELFLVELEKEIAVSSTTLRFEGTADPLVPDVYTWEDYNSASDKLEL